MINFILSGFVALALSIGGWFTLNQKPPQNFGAFGDPFLSLQVGSNPSNGYYLKTDGTNSTWAVVAGGGGSGGGTWATTTSNVSGQLINYPLNDTDIVTIGNTATTSAEFWFDPNTFVSYLKGKVGISTTSPYAALSVVGASGVVADHYTATGTVASLLPYASTTAVTAVNGYITKLGNLTSNGFVKTGSGDGTLSVDTNTYIVTGGNAGTATALAANGANCSAGSYPLGVDESGAVEDCTVAGSGSIDGAGIAGMMTSWTDSNTVQATSTIIGEQFIATSSSMFNRFAGTTTVPSLQVGPTAIANNGLKLSIPTGMTISSSESVGGLFNCNTGTTDAPCAVLYRNTTGTTRNISIVDDAATFGGNSLHVRNDGTESAFNILCAGILGKGCGKLTIQNVSDADASQLSLDASSAGYLGQGIFVDCTGGSCDATNNALSIANESGTNGMALTLKWGGKMGIGTTSPYASLSVAGDTGVVANKYHATSTTATSTFAGGLSAASSLYVLQNGNVGVSTGAAQYPLHVEKAAAGAVGYFKNTSAWGGAEYGLHVDGYSNLGGVRVNGGDGPRVFYLASGQLGFGANNNAITFESQISQEMMRIHTNGFVGIGTTSPYAALSVVGATGVVAGKYTATSTATSTFAGGIDAARVCLTGTTTCLSATGGSGTPGGSDTQVQFNDGGAFGGAVGIVWKKLTGLLGVGTTTPQWLATFSTSTAPQIGITTGAGIAGWAIRNDNAAHLTISTTSPTTFATSTNPLFELRGEAGSVSSFQMATSSTASASSTIIMGKLQFDGYSNTGTRVCAFVVGTTWTVVSGACTQ